jgi:mating-type protein A1
MEDQTLVSNVESTVLPLLSICNLTSKYYQPAPKKRRYHHFPLLSEVQEILAGAITPVITSLINESQEHFENEASIFMENDFSAAEVELLFNKYKEFVLKFMNSSKPPEALINTDGELWITDNSIDVNAIENSSDSSFSYVLSDFDFDNLTITSSIDNTDVAPYTLEFNQLNDGSESIFSDYLQFFQNEEAAQQSLVDNPTISFKESNLSAMQDFEYFTSGRKWLSKEKRDLLNRLFSVKKFPNATERKLIAEKCNMTPSQVRVWFTNKRARFRPTEKEDS